MKMKNKNENNPSKNNNNRLLCKLITCKRGIKHDFGFLSCGKQSFLGEKKNNFFQFFCMKSEKKNCCGFIF